MKHFLERAKEFIETLDYEDPKYDLVQTSIDALENYLHILENPSLHSDTSVARLANLLTIRSAANKSEKEIQKIIEG